MNCAKYSFSIFSAFFKQNTEKIVWYIFSGFVSELVSNSDRTEIKYHLRFSIRKCANPDVVKTLVLDNKNLFDVCLWDCALRANEVAWEREGEREESIIFVIVGLSFLMD